MARFLPLPLPDLPPLTLTAAIDIVIVAALIYQFLLIIRGRRAVHVLMGLGVLALIYAVAVWAKLDLLRTGHWRGSAAVPFWVSARSSAAS